MVDDLKEMDKTFLEFQEKYEKKTERKNLKEGTGKPNNKRKEKRF